MKIRNIIHISLIFCLWLCLFTTPAIAQEQPEDLVSNASSAPHEKKDIVTYWDLDSAIIAVSGATWLTMELVKDNIAPLTCNWCERNRMDDTVTDALSWNKPNIAAKTADYVAFAGIPLLALGSLAISSGLEGRIEGYPSDLMLIAEVITVSSMLNQFVKYSAGRERPYVSRGNSGLYNKPSDDNLSFYSGHTNLAFGLVVAAGTIATLRDYDAAPYIWGIGIPMATLVGYLRIAGQKHYLTDVLVGASLGSALGFLIPWLHQKTVSEGDSLFPKNHVAVSYGLNSIAISGTF